MASGSSSDSDCSGSISSTDEGTELDFSLKEPPHSWKQLQSCEEFVGAKRSKHTMVAWDDKVYVFGGDDGKRMLNDFLVSHVNDSSWARVVITGGQAPPPRYHHSAVVFRNSMFIFGGYTTGDINSNSNLRNKNDLYEYNFTTSQWIDWSDKVTGPLPPPRSAHGSVIYNDRLWVFAGYDGNTRLNDMWSIDLTSATPVWERIDQSGDSPPTCCNFPVAVVNQSMYVFSGQSGAKITNNMYEFKFNERLWVRIPTEHLLRGDTAPPQRRYGHSMVAYAGQLYVFGGAADGILDNEVHCFNVETRNWSVIKPYDGSQVPSARVFHTAAVSRDCMFVFGGTVDSIASRSGELFRFKFSSFPPCTLIKDLTKLLDNLPLCDVHFVVGDEERTIIKAHAAITAARSPFLRRKILEAYEKPSGQEDLPPFVPSSPVEVTLGGVSMSTFSHSMYYMYTDRIHPELEAPPQGDQVLLMMELYKFSLLLEARRLELLCMQYLEASVNVDNVLLVLGNASELNLQRLKEYCMKFIVRESNYRKIVMMGSFERLDQSLMVQIVRRQQYRSRPTSPSPESDDQPLPSTLQDDLRLFLLSDYGRPLSDIVLKVGGQRVLAHKPLLAARCSYFEAFFRSFMPPDNQIEISFGKTVPSQPSFQSLLKYIYYGDTDVPPEDALYIFSAPNFFGFSNNCLHVHCKAILEQNISISNVVSLLEASDFISLQEMKEHCLKLISEYFPSLVHQPDFRDLNKPLLLDVLEVIAKKIA